MRREGKSRVGGCSRRADDRMRGCGHEEHIIKKEAKRERERERERERLPLIKSE